MALPPERISIKRRRQDEPVDTLVLEPGSVQDKKRRYTDFVFQRLKHDQPNISSQVKHDSTGSKSEQSSSGLENVTVGTVDGPTEADTTASGGAVENTRDAFAKYHVLGVPVVKATKPGDEAEAYTTLKATRPAKSAIMANATVPSAASKDRSELADESNKSTSQDDSVHRTTGIHEIKSSTGATISDILLEKIKSARRFHLTRDISSALRPNSAGGIRRRKLNLRPPLATFIERQQAQHTKPAGATGTPVDRIVHLKDGTNSDALQLDKTGHPEANAKTPIKTFHKPISTTERHGQSIRDDPSTWDMESDQLANELAALAFEMDPEAAATVDAEASPVQKSKAEPVVEPMIVDGDDDYVFETYIRVRRDMHAKDGHAYLGDDFGVLVINEEDHDLWEKYVHEDDDDDDDWDDEDEDSNAEDNPRNDYPEDEVSSDDEYGHNVYRHRHNASDDEQYDDENQW